jgi:hypothetical protein
MPHICPEHRRQILGSLRLWYLKTNIWRNADLAGGHTASRPFDHQAGPGPRPKILRQAAAISWRKHASPWRMLSAREVVPSAKCPVRGQCCGNSSQQAEAPMSAGPLTMTP